MSGVHQFVPMLHVGDAVGQHALGLQSVLADRGVESRIYVELEDAETTSRSRPATAYPGDARAGDVLVYQFATASDLAGWLVDRPETLVVNYHNVTPPELFAPWDTWLARHQLRARQELGRLAGRAALGVAVSEHNRADLVAAGFATTEVVPPIVDLAAGATAVPAATGGDARRHRGARWLSVGRVAPNKAVEDTVCGLLAFRARHDGSAALDVVGRPAIPGYAAALAAYTAELGLADAVRFVGRLSNDALGRAYRDADVLVVTSEHEGYCLPVVEAMANDLPVVAYRQGAVPEVLGDAGVQLEQKDPLSLAAAVERLQTDAGWRRAVVEAGRARVPELGLADAGPRLADLLVARRGAVTPPPPSR